MKRTVLVAALVAAALAVGVAAGLGAGSRLSIADAQTTTQIRNITVTSPPETVTNEVTTTIRRTKIKTVPIEPEPSPETVLSGTRKDPNCGGFAEHWKRCGTTMPTVTVHFGGYLRWSCTSACEFVDSTGELSVAEDGAYGPSHGELYIGPGPYSVKLWADGKYVLRFPA